MKLPIILFLISFFERFKKVSDIILDQQGTTQNSHDFNDWTVKLQFMLNDSDETIGDDANVNLDTYSILVFSPKRFNPKMLLDPFEKQLDLPAMFVKKCNIFCFKIEVICVVCEGSFKFRRIVYDSPDRSRVILFVSFPGKPDNLIKKDIITPFKKFFTIENLVVGTELFSNDKCCPTHIDCEQSGQVKVASIKDIAHIRLVCKPVHRPDIMDVCICNSVKDWDFRNDVNLGMNLDSRLGTSELCPVKDRHAQVNRSGVNSIKFPVKLKFPCDAFALGNCDHVESKLFKDSVISDSICFRQNLSVDGRFAETKKKRLVSMCNCNICKFPQTAASQQLTEYENHQLVPMSKTPSSCSVVVFHTQPLEEPLRQELGYLRKDIVPRMHFCSNYDLGTKFCISKVRQGFEELCYCA